MSVLLPIQKLWQIYANLQIKYTPNNGHFAKAEKSPTVVKCPSAIFAADLLQRNM